MTSFNHSLESKQTYIGLGEVAIEGGRVELRQDVDLVDVGIDAVADWNVYEAVVSTQGHSRLGPLLGQRVQPGARPSSQDHPQHRLHAVTSHSAAWIYHDAMP